MNAYVSFMAPLVNVYLVGVKVRLEEKQSSPW